MIGRMCIVQAMALDAKCRAATLKCDSACSGVATRRGYRRHPHAVESPAAQEVLVVLAYHLVISAYGFWLPNDPRGSGSDFIRSWELFYQGPATLTHSQRSAAHDPHDRALRLHQKQGLHHEPVAFTELQIEAIAGGFQNAIRRSGFVLYACSILSTHTHLVVARHRYEIEQVANQFNGEATKELKRRGLHPFPETFARSGKQHSPWADDSWDVYLDTREDILRSIK